jgi:hypothetical protein
MTTHSNPLVADYLRQLERASASLPRARRVELAAEIREHIDDALLEAGAADDVAVRNVLERLGEPEEIVAAAVPAQSSPTGRAGVLEIAALVALAIPVVGWFMGIPLLIVSRAWSGSDRAIGSLLSILPAFVIGFLYAGLGASEESVGTIDEQGDGGLGPIEVVIMGLIYLSGLAGSIYLALRLRRGRHRQAVEA